MSEQKTYIFHIDGMHCKACVSLVESELNDVSEIFHTKASLKNFNVEIEGDFKNKEPELIAQDLSKILKPYGYTLSVDGFDKLTTGKQKKNWKEFKIAIPIAIAFAILFVVLQKIGLINLVNVGNVSYWTAFVIGIIASLSTCMAVVGGIVLSMSAIFAREADSSTSLGTDKLKPQILFHAGRIVSFFILGGVIGAIGSAFTLSVSATFILGIIIGVVMLILGINLLDVFDWAKKLQPSMPKFLSKHVLGVSKWNHTFTPLFIGVATFFLPCGFTQSMQLYTLTTGNFLSGGLTMFFFALGTLPVLSLISFSSFTIKNSSKAGVFFKTAGLVVIMFALFNLINSLVVLGLIPPVFNF